MDVSLLRLITQKALIPASCTPAGPGSYDVSERTFQKASFERTKTGGLSTCPQRSSFILPDRESIETPGPGQYEVRRSVSAHTFVSNGQRHGRQCVVKLRPGGQTWPRWRSNPACSRSSSSCISSTSLNNAELHSDWVVRLLRNMRRSHLLWPLSH